MRAWMIGNILYFDSKAWALLLEHARRKHQSPKKCAIAAIRRGIKLEKSKKSRNQA